MLKENKTDRIGMRVSPQQKERWNAVADAWGYRSLSDWMATMCDWAIQFEKFETFDDFLESLKNE